MHSRGAADDHRATRRLHLSAAVAREEWARSTAAEFTPQELVRAEFVESFQPRLRGADRKPGAGRGFHAAQSGLEWLRKEKRHQKERAALRRPPRVLT